MKTSIYKFLSWTTFAILVLNSVSIAQISVSGNETRTAAVDKAQEAVKEVILKSGTLFNEGLLALEDNNRSDAGEKFNKSVEVFLYSTLNIQREQKLQTCYNQLIETIYRIEFPNGNQPPQVKNLALTCTWNIDGDLADRVTAMTQKAPAAGSTLPGTAVAVNTTSAAAPINVGFNTQAFEPSPLDDLSKLELTPDEQDVTSPDAQKNYQYIQYAVANKSLGFAFQVHPMIQQYINYYRGRGQKTMEVGLYRSGMFMLMARRIFKEEGIPENVAWLGQVESAWKPSAMSHMAASGLWQFIPGTGAMYGLKRTAYVDERNSFDEATRASARYLKFLYNRYGNWELAMAGYNCGEGNVDRAVRRAGVTNFWAAYPYLPRETRNYVPNILATILIANNPHAYGFGHIRPAAPLRYDRVRIPGSTNLSLIAQASDTSVQYLRYLNPHLRSNMTPPEPYVINVPPSKGDEVVAVFRRIPASKVNNTNLANSSSGETWQTIANRTGISVADLMAANPGLSAPRGKVFVPVRGNGVQATSYSRPTNSPISSVKAPKSVRAEAGDTLQRIASREKVNPLDLAKFNGLHMNSKLGKGQVVKIPAM